VTLTDAAIVRRVLDGDVDAYGVLVDRYHDHYARFARHLMGNDADAEEVLQDTFLRAFHALDRYENRERFGAWLLRILINRARTVNARSRRRDRLFRERVHETGEWTEPSVPHPAERAALREEMQRALAQLSDDQRETFLLHYVEELSYEEISEITGIGISALKMRAKRACERLRVLLEEANRV
jgi:RNA polymerase sigma-70 factor (ECF subfamily)